MNLKKIFLRLLPVFAILGPGIISGSADNDAGGIATYSLAGSRFGFSLLWVLVLTTFALAVTQEIGARMGLVTGKGLASLIRENFGIKWTAFIMIILLVANLGTIAAEFAGIAAAFEIVNVSRFISVPLIAIAIFALVTKGDFRKLERIFLVTSAFYIVYIISAVISHPDWGSAAKSIVTPTIHLSKEYLLTMIALIGTTITPWGQFFIQDYVVDKKLSKEDLSVERVDVYFGSFITNFISFFIIVACASTIYAHGLTISSAKDAAVALQPFAGHLATILFSFGLLNASFFGAALVPVSTAYVVTEAFGFESGLNLDINDAPQFYGLFAFCLIIGALFVILPFMPLLAILFVSQAINALLLLPVLVFLFLLSNNKKILGSYHNSFFMNIIIAIVFIAIALSAAAYFLSIFL